MFLFAGLSCNNDLEETDLSPVKIELNMTEKKIVEDQNDFAFKLFASLYETSTDQSKNMLISPFSVHCALGMLSNGAVGETKTGILSAMQLGGYEQSEVNDYFQKMIQGLVGADPAVLFETANSIWYNKNIRLKDDFVRSTKKQYEAEITSLDFSNASSVARINDWCKKKTKGKIPKIIDEVYPQAIAYLLNAVYFKARWQSVFSEQKTSKAPFYLENGQTSTVDFMHKDGSFYSYSDELFSTIALPYSTGTYYMRLIVPAESASLKEVVTALSKRGYLADCLQKSEVRDVELSLPRFEIESDNELKEALSMMGMNASFNLQQADFSDLADNSFIVSGVKHSACFKVDEEGSEGAAVTAIMTDGAFIEPHEKLILKADRPFLFMVTENETGAILFMGKVGVL